MGVYSSLKCFDWIDRVKVLPQESKVIACPVHVRIKPTNRCNHSCTYCSYRVADMQLGSRMDRMQEMPWQQLQQILEDCKSLSVKAVTFSGGGEPLLYEKLPQAIDYLCRQKIKVGVITNGSRLLGGAAKAIAEKAVWVRVSIDGWDGDSYADYRGVSKDEFGRVMGNVQSFCIMQRKAKLGLAVVVDRRNYEHLEELLRRVRDLGVDNVKVMPVIVSDDWKENLKYHAPITNYVKAVCARFPFVSCSFDEELQSWEKEYEWCPSIQLNPVIGADGYIYPCHDKAYSYSLFAIGAWRLAKVWTLNKDRFFEINPKRDCKHHCAVNYRNKLLLEYLRLEDREFV